MFPKLWNALEGRSGRKPRRNFAHLGVDRHRRVNLLFLRCPYSGIGRGSRPSDGDPAPPVRSLLPSGGAPPAPSGIRPLSVILSVGQTHRLQAGFFSACARAQYGSGRCPEGSRAVRVGTGRLFDGISPRWVTLISVVPEAEGAGRYSDVLARVVYPCSARLTAKADVQSTVRACRVASGVCEWIGSIRKNKKTEPDFGRRLQQAMPPGEHGPILSSAAPVHGRGWRNE